MIRDLFSKILTRSERWQAAFVMGIILVQSMVEVVGIGSVVPFLQLLADPGKALENTYVAWVHRFVGSPSQNVFILQASVALLVIFLVKNLFIVVCEYIKADFCLKTQHRLTTTLLRKFLTRDYSFFFSANTSVLLRYVTNEAMNVSQGVLLYALTFLSECITFFFVLLLLLWANPALSISMAAGAGVLFFFIFALIRNRSSRYGNIARASSDELFKIASAALSGVKDIKVMAREDFFVDKFTKSSLVNTRMTTHVRVLGAVPRLFLETAVVGGILSIVFFGIYTQGSIHSYLPLLGLYAIAAYRFMPAVSKMLSSVTNFRFHRPSVDIVITALNFAAQPSTIEANHSERLPLQDLFEIKDLSYSYPSSSKLALNNVSLSIKAGESVGVVGTSGAGKTTLVDIILGLLLPESGSLFVDGKAINNENIRSWRQSVGYVPQQIFLSDDSLRANIAFGIPSQKIDLQKIERAIKVSQLNEFMTGLPDGLETQVGERGIQLSGGQRQRIGIARALYDNPSVIVLDEATSALDGITEANFNRSIEALRGEKTLVVIAHRLSTVRNCDKILVMKEGKIVGEGTYTDLLRECEEFKSLAASYLASANADGGVH